MSSNLHLDQALQGSTQPEDRREGCQVLRGVGRPLGCLVKGEFGGEKMGCWGIRSRKEQEHWIIRVRQRRTKR